MRWLGRSALLAVALYGAAVIFMYAAQRSLLYPRVVSNAVVAVPVASQNLPRARDVTFTTGDGITLRGWRIEPARPDALTYLYFHGNAKSLTDRAERFRLMGADGSGVLAYGYRGYTGSDGEPSEAALKADALAIYAALKAEVGEARIVVVGESLGSGVALHLAQFVAPRALILDSPFLSVLDRAQANYPWLPVPLLLKDTFRSDLVMPKITVPVLIVHGTEDRTTPVGDSARLAALAKPGVVTRIVYPGEPHVVPWHRGPERDVAAFLAGLKP